MTREQVEQRLVEAGVTADAEFPLLDAAIACAQHQDPARDPSTVHTLVAEAVLEVARRLDRQAPHEALASTLAEHLGLVGDRLDYDHPDNADIISVCERRRGLPVALGIVYIEVAKCCALRVRGVDFPGHFLLRMDTQEGPMALDPFDDGRRLSPAELARRARSIGARSELVRAPGRLIAPVGDRAVLTRLQNNILTRARIAGDHSCAEGAALRRALLNPADGHFWLDVAAVREERGAVTGALEALERAKGIGPGAARAAQAARLRLRAKLN